jgi:hypothetical protein
MARHQSLADHHLVDGGGRGRVEADGGQQGVERESGAGKLRVHAAGEVDLCSTNPGFEIDLYVTSPLRSLTAIWMGFTTVSEEVKLGNVELIGDAEIAKSMQQWLGLSPFAKEKGRVAA